VKKLVDIKQRNIVHFSKVPFPCWHKVSVPGFTYRLTRPLAIAVATEALAREAGLAARSRWGRSQELRSGSSEHSLTSAQVLVGVLYILHFSRLRDCLPAYWPCIRSDLHQDRKITALHWNSKPEFKHVSWQAL